MNHNPLGTDPLRRSLFRKTEPASPQRGEEIIASKVVPAPLSVSLEELPEKLEVITFYLGVEEFSIEVNRVKEIVRLVEITPVPKAPFFVEGIIDVRGEIVPVISLKKMFALGEERYTLHTQIIITEIDKRIIGLIADATGEIISLEKEKIKPPLETLPLHNFLFGIAELEEQLLLLLDLNKILSYEQKILLEVITSQEVTASDLEKVIPLEQLEKLTSEEKIFRNILHQRAFELSKRKTIEEKEKKQVLTFSVGEGLYGLVINQVKEIVKPRKIVYLPSVPVHLAGIINLRGELIPVVNLSRLFGIGLTVSQEWNNLVTNGKIKIVIAQIERMKVGFLVDVIYDVVSLTADTFEPPLATIEKGRIEYLSAQTHWENKILGLLNLENIVKSI
ncbi:MAG TPA: hypothetical protein DHV62_03725 [Elusimicrobia bacterium]|jgi:purine-binding chemotaxis protein CheW|nr:hypothetical protein [Elusimicrobiota bacterium]